jgi:hypothetical protein
MGGSTPAEIRNSGAIVRQSFERADLINLLPAKGQMSPGVSSRWEQNMGWM